MNPKLYPNQCVRRVTAFIPEGHRHVRLILEFCDGETIILHEATVAGIVRAYASTALHPTRKAVSLTSRKLEHRKPGYAEWQLVEEELDEGEILSVAMEKWITSTSVSSIGEGGD